MSGRSSSNLYSVLGLDKDASAKDIKRAYFDKAKVLHPDKGGDPEAFKEILRAYETLSDSEKRSFYDMTGQVPGENGAPDNAGGGMPQGFPFGMGMPGGAPGFAFDINELFGMFGGGGGGGGGSSRNRKLGKPPPKVENMYMDLRQFYNGANFNIHLDRQKICKKCDGTGADSKENCSQCGGSGKKQQVMMMGNMQMISTGPCLACSGNGWKAKGVCSDCSGTAKLTEKRKINFSLVPGMKTRETVILSEVCSEMIEFDRPGDLHVIFHLKETSGGWRRIGQAEEHLLYELTINLAESLLGLAVQLYGHPGYQEGLFLRIPGAINGDVFCYEDLGMPIVGQSGKFGKGYVRIFVSPESDERELLFVKARVENGPSLKELFSSRVRKVTIGPETEFNDTGYLSSLAGISGV